MVAKLGRDGGRQRRHHRHVHAARLVRRDVQRDGHGRDLRHCDLELYGRQCDASPCSGWGRRHAVPRHVRPLERHVDHVWWGNTHQPSSELDQSDARRHFAEQHEHPRLRREHIVCTDEVSRGHQPGDRQDLRLLDQRRQQNGFRDDGPVAGLRHQQQRRR